MNDQTKQTSYQSDAVPVADNVKEEIFPDETAGFFPEGNAGVHGTERQWKNIGLIMTACLLLSVGAMVKTTAPTTLRGSSPTMGSVRDGTQCWIDQKIDWNFKTIGQARPNMGTVWIDKKDGWDFKTVGRGRPNGGGIDTAWIDKKLDGLDFQSVGRTRPNGHGFDTVWIEKKDGWDFQTIGRARPNGGTVWIDKKDGWDFETVGKIRPNSGSDDCSSAEIVAAAGYLLLLDDEA